MAENMDDPLSVQQWLVTLDPDTKAAYRMMREAEDEWLEAAEAVGCKLAALPHDRRIVVLVPPGIKLPDHTAMVATRATYTTMIGEIAAEQGKRRTVGTRSGSLPHWVGGDAIGGEPPAYLATRVRWRTQAAYRSGQLTPEQAIDYLLRRVRRQEEVLAKAEEQYRHDRVERLTEAVERAEHEYQDAQDFLSRNTSIKARLRSGDAYKISVYGKATADDAEKQTVSFSASLPSIALVPAAPDCVVEPAPHRNRASTVRVLKTCGNVEFIQ